MKYLILVVASVLYSTVIAAFLRITRGTWKGCRDITRIRPPEVKVMGNRVVINGFIYPSQAEIEDLQARVVEIEGRNLRTYDPATHIVVSREAGERVAKIIEYDVCGRENCKCGELAAELRAALEGEHE